MSARTKARKRALDVLFEADQRGLPVLEVLLARLANSGAETPLPEYSEHIVRGVAEHAQSLDATIAAALTDWTLERVPAVDRAILRVAAWEVLHNQEVAIAVAIDEAVSMAAVLSTDDSAAFINGVLGTIARDAPERHVLPENDPVE